MFGNLLLLRLELTAFKENRVWMTNLQVTHLKDDVCGQDSSNSSLVIFISQSVLLILLPIVDILFIEASFPLETELSDKGSVVSTLCSCSISNKDLKSESVALHVHIIIEEVIELDSAIHRTSFPVKLLHEGGLLLALRCHFDFFPFFNEMGSLQFVHDAWLAFDPDLLYVIDNFQLHVDLTFNKRLLR